MEIALLSIHSRFVALCSVKELLLYTTKRPKRELTREVISLSFASSQAQHFRNLCRLKMILIMQSMIDRITWKFCVPSRTRIGLRTEYLPETHRRLPSAVPPSEAASTLLNLTLKSVFWFRAELQPRWHHLNGDAWRCHDLRRVGRDSLTDVGHRAPHLDHRRSRRGRHQERRVVEVLALDLADRRAAHVLQWLRDDFAMDDRSNH